MQETSNYSSRLCVSSINKHLINTICRDTLLRNKPDLEGVNITENMIITSMIKVYTDRITLKDLEEEFNEKYNH